MTTRKTTDRASRVEIVAINKRLEETVTKLEDGLCVYAEGVSDQTIADELKVGVRSVAGLRVDLFGKLKPYGTVEDRVDDLVKLSGNLVTSYDTLKDRHNKLVMLLALNRVVDCRHLEVQ